MMRFPIFLCSALLAFGAAGMSVRAASEAEPATEPAVIAVGKTMPAVVNISTEGTIRKRVQDPYQQFFDNFYGNGGNGTREFRQKVQSLGSGFIADPRGYIVTNQHAIERADDLKIEVTTSDGKVFVGRYISGDAALDLALIKIDSPKPLPCIDLRDLSPNLLGQTVLELGNPLGYGSSVSRGILSATNRSVTIENVEYANLVQTDAAINPGNSGGPLVDLSGRLVGVNSVKMAFTPQGVPTQGIGFAIPGSAVRSRLAGFLKDAANGKATALRPADGALATKLFGLQTQPMTKELAETMGFEPGHGVLIADVQDDSPAADAGLVSGLVIFKVGRYVVDRPADLEKLLAKAESGDRADFTVGVTRRVNGRLYPQVQTVTLTAR